MKHSTILFCSVIAAMVVLAAGAATARAESCTLEMKYVESPHTGVGSAVQSQNFGRQIFSKGREHEDAEVAAFAKVVKKEPAKYQSEFPVRGVVKFGSDEFAFVLDAKDAKSNTYSRLYFDLNHNGDLTDDKVIEADSSKDRGLSRNYLVVFPRVDLTIHVDGKEVKYAFFPQTYTYEFITIAGKDKEGKEKREHIRYVSIQFSSAAYREGRMTLDGKPRHVILLDSNSNGRFDDQLRIANIGSESDQRVYPQYGDMLLVDYRRDRPSSLYDLEIGGRHHLSKLMNFYERLYDVTVTPTGDRLTLTPSPASFGTVTSPQEGFSGTLYGDNGLATVDLTLVKQCDVPEGDWRLLSYSIQRTVEQLPESKKEKPEAAPSLLGALLDALGGDGGPATARSVHSMVMAYGTRGGPVIKVRKGQTVSLPFGPPYKPVVKARAAGKTANLEMSLVGAGGEVCASLMVDNKRPSSPKFTITTSKGEVVESGSFEYG
jgi:hypothetical protein